MINRTIPLWTKAAELGGTFEGYASVFNNVDAYSDTIQPGAFSASLAAHRDKGTMPALLWQHDSSEPIGIYTDMREDSHGLHAKGQLLVDQNVPAADKAFSLLKAKAVQGLSIGFAVPEGGQEYDSERGLNVISQIDLWETSLVTFPRTPTPW